MQEHHHRSKTYCAFFHLLCHLNRAQYSADETATRRLIRTTRALQTTAEMIIVLLSLWLNSGFWIDKQLSLLDCATVTTSSLIVTSLFSTVTDASPVLTHSDNVCRIKSHLLLVAKLTIVAWKSIILGGTSLHTNAAWIRSLSFRVQSESIHCWLIPTVMDEVIEDDSFILCVSQRHTPHAHNP